MDESPAAPDASRRPRSGTSRRRRAWTSRRRHPSTPLRSRLGGGLPRAFWFLWAGTAVNRAGGFVQPFLLLYLTTQRELSVGRAGAVLTAWGAGAALSQPLGGVLTDRLGRRATMSLGLAATGVALLGLGFARGLPVLIVVAAAVGVVGDLYRPASSAAIADLVPSTDRTRAFALQYWAINLGFSLAAVSGGLIAHRSYLLLFVLDAATCLAYSGLVLLGVPETRPSEQTVTTDAEAPGSGLRVMLADRLLLGTVLAVLAYAVLYLQLYTLLPLRTRDLSLGSAVYGAIIAVNGVAVLVLQPALIPVITRVPRSILLPVSMLLVGGGLAGFGITGSPAGLIVFMVVFTIGEIGFTGAVQAFVVALAPLALRGRYLGAVGLAWGASALVGPALGTGVYSANPTAAWCGAAGLGVVAALAFRALIGAYDRRQTEAVTTVPAPLTDPAQSA